MKRRVPVAFTSPFVLGVGSARSDTFGQDKGDIRYAISPEGVRTASEWRVGSRVTPDAVPSKISRGVQRDPCSPGGR